MNQPPLSVRLLKQCLPWMPRRLRGHAVKHLGRKLLPAEFAAVVRDRGLFPFISTIWDAGRYYGLFEPEEDRFFSTIIAPGQTIVDVGANVGWYTARFLFGVGAGGRVLAIEPDPANVARLQRIASLRNRPDNFTIIESAVADVPGS